MSHRPLAAIASGAAVVVLLTIGSGLGVASSTTVECGQLSAYTAPDPTGPTDGSLQLGLSSAWDVLTTATISFAATAALPSGVNSGPTCLALGFDGAGKIDSIDFAAHGTITGSVDFDSGSGYYVFASRLLVPAAITSAYPAIGALFASSYQAGSILSITFNIDPSSGGFTGFDGHAAFCGTAALVAGNGKVGKATIPGSILSAAAKAALAKDSGQTVCAKVHSTGTIDPSSGNIATTAAVVITADPSLPRATPPSTATLPSDDVPQPASTSVLAWLSIAVGSALVMTRLVARPRRRR